MLPNTSQLGAMTSSAEAIGLMQSLAEITWTRLGDARRLGIGFSEDTISDLNALEIARHSHGTIDVQRVSKRKERFVGFDWLWLIDRPGGRHATYVVQAKKLRLTRSQNYSYGRLKYPPKPPYQIDALQAFADYIDAVPLYCFYNNIDDSIAERHWNCRQQSDVPQMGCTLAPLDVVRPVHNGLRPSNFYSIHLEKETIPWRCLFHQSCTNFSLDRISERSTQNNMPDSEERERGYRAATYLRERNDTEEGTVDFDEFVREFDLEDLVARYRFGSFHPMMERAVSIRLED